MTEEQKNYIEAIKNIAETKKSIDKLTEAQRRQLLNEVFEIVEIESIKAFMSNYLDNR